MLFTVLVWFASKVRHILGQKDAHANQDARRNYFSCRLLNLVWPGPCMKYLTFAHFCMSMMTIAVVSLYPDYPTTIELDFLLDDRRGSVREGSTRPIRYSTQKKVSLPYSIGAGRFGRLSTLQIYSSSSQILCSYSQTSWFL